MLEGVPGTHLPGCRQEHYAGYVRLEYACTLDRDVLSVVTFQLTKDGRNSILGDGNLGAQDKALTADRRIRRRSRETNSDSASPQVRTENRIGL